MYLTAQSLRLTHAFSTRQGGVSRGPFSSLNLGRSVGDDPRDVEENARRFAASLGLRAGQLASANQVHGDAVLEVTAVEAGQGLPRALGDADGLVTRTRGAALCIRTADCVPVLLHAPDVIAVGAAHAGWRGTIAGAPARVVETLSARYGANPRLMTAVIGPSIRRCCYEVGEDLAAQFEARFGPRVIDRAGHGPRLDLAEANRLALLEAGLAAEAVEVLGCCTCCDRERFFSHRRDRGNTGRHVSLIVL